MNTVQLIGRLTKDVDLKHTASSIAVGTFTLAVQRNFTNAEGEKEADFINCVIWRKSAENLANFVKKGSQVGIEGRLQSRTYDKDDGTRVYVTEVVVSSFTLLGSRQDNENGSQHNSNNYNNNQNSSYQSQGNYSQNQNNSNSQNNNYNNNQSQVPSNQQQQGNYNQYPNNGNNQGNYNNNQNQGGYNNQNQGGYNNQNFDQRPQAGRNYNYDSTPPIDISEDDLPF